MGEDHVLTREQILGNGELNLKTVDVEIPEWGGVVRLREMRGRERMEYEEFVSQEGVGSADVITKLIVLTAVDEKGTRIFTDEDAERLKNLGTSVLLKIFNAARELNMLTEEAVEKLEKNSEPEPSEDSVLA